ncbi:MAG: hypothetical protein ABI680_07375, partial [Chthoniobacteraceae bacterium]
MKTVASPHCSKLSTRLPWKLPRHGVALALVALSLPNSGRAADVTSTWNTTTGVWGDAANWTPNTFFPNNGNGGSTYDAVLSNGGTIELDQDITIEKLALSNGGVTGDFDLTLNDQLTWNGGGMSGSGTTYANGGILSDNAILSLSERTLINPAGQTAMLTNPFRLAFTNGGVFSNHGVMEMALDRTSAFVDFGGGGTFNNSGTAMFSTLDGRANFLFDGNMVVNNTGTLSVAAGFVIFMEDGATVTQYNGSALTGGTWRLGEFMNLPRTGSGIVTNQADITLIDYGSFFAGSSMATLESTLETNSGAL